MGPALWDQLGACSEQDPAGFGGMQAIKPLPENSLSAYDKAARKV